MALFLPADERVYFLHIPKTAGTSVASVLGQFFAHEEVCPAQVQAELDAIEPGALAGYRLFSGHFWGLPARLPARPRVITMLREPAARAVSYYRHIRRDPGHQLHELARQNDFSALVRHAALRNGQVRHVAASHEAYRPNLEDGDCLVLAHEMLDRADVVGLVENTAVSLTLVCRRFGWPTGGVSPRLNTAGEGTDEAPLTDAQFALLEEAHQLDKELYAHAERRFWQDVRTGLEEAVEESYERRMAHDAQHGRAELHAGDAIAGHGWYPPEAWPGGGVHRWMGPAPVATMDLPLAPGRYRLLLELGAAIRPDVLSGLQIQAWSQPLELPPLRSSPPYRLKTRVDASAEWEAHGFLRLRFCVPDTVSPQALGQSDDARLLGVAFTALRVVPA